MSTVRGKRRRPAGAVPARRAPTEPVRRARTTVRREIGGVPMSTVLLSAAMLIALVGGLAFAFDLIPDFGPGPTPTAAPITPRPLPSGLGPPSATPLAIPPAAPAGDGTQATIETRLGNIVMELYTDSSPVAAQNFINLADAGFYNGVVFHRIVPDFIIQGGDPEGTGGGGPGYTIPDEPLVGTYTRGTVAMARTGAPNSQGSQFFVVVADSPNLAQGSNGNPYAIFGRVVSGMDVVDRIVAMPNAGDPGNEALDPVVMDRVTIQRP
jgi:cyclophilin family peptidyl-prolyl cis-trans isomerase